MNYKRFSFLALIFFLATPFFAQSQKNEGYLYANIVSHVASESYVSALNGSAFFLKTYKSSVYTNDVLLLRAKSLYFTDEIDDSLAILKLLNLNKAFHHADEVSYFSGLCLYKKGRFFEASHSFFYVLSSGDQSYKTQSLYYAAECMYRLFQYDQAILLLEPYILESSKKNQKLERASSMLYDSYDKEGNSKKIISFFEKASLKDFSLRTKENCLFFVSKAYLKEGAVIKAYSILESLLYSVNDYTALKALESLYKIACEYDTFSEKKVLEMARNRKFSNTQLLRRLQVQSGISAFKEGNKTSAKEYFLDADKNGVLEGDLYALSGLYQALLSFDEGDTKKALDFVQNRFDMDGFYAPWQLVFESFIQAHNKNFTQCKIASKKAIEEIEKENALYPVSLYKDATRFYALALFSEGEYQKSLDVLTTAGLSTELLYVQSLFMSGYKKRAQDIFSAQFSQTNEAILVWLHQKKYEKAYEMAKNNNNSYLCGLATFALSDWRRASFYFQQSIIEKSYPISKKMWVDYYYALSLYKENQYKTSLARFDIFLDENPQHLKVFDAHKTAALCAMQIGDSDSLKRALEHAKNAILSAQTESDTYEAILLSAHLYKDTGDIKKAIALLEPFSKSMQVESLSIRLNLASLYAENGDIEKADDLLFQTATVFDRTNEGREAAYRRGELYYRTGQYEKAADLFSSFRYEWGNGLFSDAALFFGADSLEKSGNVDRALFLYDDLLVNWQDSPYVFASLDKASILHRSRGEYDQSLSFCIDMLSLFGDQARKIGIEQRIKELKLLKDGADEKTAVLRTLWNKNKKETTIEGRKTGYELALLYLASEKTAKEGNDILVAIDKELSTGSLVGESLLHADVLGELGKYNRKIYNYEKAAQLYLASASFYVENGGGQKNEKAAFSLYAAIESFESAKKYADAKAVYENLRDRFSDSQWSEAARQIMEKYYE